MSVLIVDTSVWVDYFKGVPVPEIDDALQEGRLYLPVVVVAELTSAQISTSKRHALIDFLRELPLADAGFEHWLRVGQLRSKAGRVGLNISTSDAHVAQCSLDLRARLLSADKVFRKLKEMVCPDLQI